MLLWGIILSMIPLPLMMGVRNAGTFLICIALLLTISLAFLLPLISPDGAQVLLVDKPTMSIVLAIPGGITALILLPAGHLAGRVGRKPPIVDGLALLTVCFAGDPGLVPRCTGQGAGSGIGHRARHGWVSEGARASLWPLSAAMATALSLLITADLPFADKVVIICAESEKEGTNE